MKKSNLLLFTLLFSLGTFYAYPQTAEISNEIIDALNSGDSSTLSSFFNDNVELVVDNKNDIFSKQQASSIISDFFRKNATSGFSLIHKGEKEAACFAIGTLKTSNGSFRVYVLTRKNGKKDVIQQLRIEPSND